MHCWLSKAVICFGLIVHGYAGFGQEAMGNDKARIQLSLEGMAGISFGEKMVAFNVGGPNLLMGIGQHWRVGLAAFPSFFVRNSKTGARLGVGGRIDYNKLVLFSSFYHFDTKEVWVGTIGLGYKFHATKPKK